MRWTRPNIASGFYDYILWCRHYRFVNTGGCIWVLLWRRKIHVPGYGREDNNGHSVSNWWMRRYSTMHQMDWQCFELTQWRGAVEGGLATVCKNPNGAVSFPGKWWFIATKPEDQTHDTFQWPRLSWTRWKCFCSVVYGSWDTMNAYIISLWFVLY